MLTRAQEKRVREYLEENKLSMRDIAKLVGVSRGTVANYAQRLFPARFLCPHCQRIIYRERLQSRDLL